MRKLWAAGAAMLVCLALGGLPAVGQDEAEPSTSPAVSLAPAAMEAAVVTGTEICGVSECQELLSDPRVNGRGYVRMQFDCHVEPAGSPTRPGCVLYGTFTIRGPDGAWQGPWSGLWDPSLEKVSLLVHLEGTGAYEGWAFVAHYLDTGYGSADVNGVIFEGSPPPMRLLSAASE